MRGLCVHNFIFQKLDLFCHGCDLRPHRLHLCRDLSAGREWTRSATTPKLLLSLGVAECTAELLVGKAFLPATTGDDPTTLLRTCAIEPQWLEPKWVPTAALARAVRHSVTSQLRTKKREKQGETKRGRPRTPAKARAPRQGPEAAGGERVRADLCRAKPLHLLALSLSFKE